MFKEFNAHPKGIKTDDCVVRAIATVTNNDYLEVRRDLNLRKGNGDLQVTRIQSFCMNT